MASRLSSLQPLHQAGGLVQQISRRIAADIALGKLGPGARLPTEQEMMAAMGVSRTVVREAVAALRAEGLVNTRQGVGAFVVDVPKPSLFSLAPGQDSALADAVDIMELRAAVETEAAGLAAQRATAAQRRTIALAFAAIDAAIKRGEAAVAEDFAFHAAITDATGNRQFRRFLEFLGSFIIPRSSVRILSADLPAYLATFQQEHRQILEAIKAKSPQRAQAAMRDHLLNSRERYRALAPD
jgi:GntR family transcriptional repressor for pyruvate dehydrogenase complex